MKFLTLLLEHWEAVAGIVGTITALFTKPPTIRRPNPATTTKEASMHLIADLEAKLHAVADEFSAHNDIEKLKTGLSAVYAIAKPILSIGLQTIAPVAAQVAQEAIATKFPGELGAAIGSVAAAAITSEAGALTAKAAEAVAPTPAVE